MTVTDVACTKCEVEDEHDCFCDWRCGVARCAHVARRNLVWDALNLEWNSRCPKCGSADVFPAHDPQWAAADAEYDERHKKERR